MFGNDKTKRNPDIDSLVGSNTEIRGNVHFSGGLHIDGAISGNITAEGENSTITTSNRGKVQGDLIVDAVILNGYVVGDVHAAKHLELAPNAKVDGNVYYEMIEMASGAEVNGKMIHGSSAQQAPLSSEESNATQATAQAELGAVTPEATVSAVATPANQSETPSDDQNSAPIAQSN